MHNAASLAMLELEVGVHMYIKLHSNKLCIYPWGDLISHPGPTHYSQAIHELTQRVSTVQRGSTARLETCMKIVYKYLHVEIYMLRMY